MKCEKCNHIQKKGEKYCENCGIKFGAYKRMEPILSKKAQIGILATVIAFLLFFCGYQIGNYMTSPSWIARNYFEKVVNNDISAIYKLVGENDSTFYNQNLLKEKMELFETVDSYQILAVDIQGREALVTFEYYLENDSKAYYANVKLYRNSKKKWLFYDNWNVESGKVVENITIEAPKNASVTIDGIDIKEFKNSEKSTDTIDVYQIETMVAGTYEVQIKMNHDITATENIEVTDHATYTLGDVTLPDTVKEELENKTLELVRTLYTGATLNQTFESIQSSLHDVSDLDMIEDRYIALKRSIQNGLIQYQTIDISRISLQLATYQDGKWVITMTMTHHDSGTYVVSEQTKDYKQTDLKTTILVTVVEQEDIFKIENIRFGSLR